MQYNEGYNDRVFALNKPVGVSSAGLLNQFKREHKIKKMGHAGTLDPLASGVLVVATGKCTKQLMGLMKGDKEYIAKICIGATTISLDSEFWPTEFENVEVSKDEIKKVLKGFVGKIEQVPPIYSAIKISGKRGYKNLDLESKLQPRVVKIDSIELIDLKNINPYELPSGWEKLDLKKARETKELQKKIVSNDSKSNNLVIGTIKITSQKGVYIRSLARDIAAKLGHKGYMTSLVRSRVGDYSLEDCVD